MFVDYGFKEGLFLLLIVFFIILASVVFPVYGYRRKRWKGITLGCILQPVACAIALALIISCFVGYELLVAKQRHKAAMVTVRTTEQGTYGIDTLTWYLKPDEECLVECLLHEKTKYPVDDSIIVDKRRDFFDVIRLDSLSHAVCVEDRIIVRFDLQNQKVTATDYDHPAEVISTDWEKVRSYFHDNP